MGTISFKLELRPTADLIDVLTKIVLEVLDTIKISPRPAPRQLEHKIKDGPKSLPNVQSACMS